MAMRRMRQRRRSPPLLPTAREIAGMLVPAKVCKADVRRITLRKRDDVLLQRILMGGTRLKRYDETNIDDDADYLEQDNSGGNNNIITHNIGGEEDPLTSLLPSKTYDCCGGMEGAMDSSLRRGA